MECISLCAWHVLFDRAEALTNSVSLCMWLVNAGHYSPGYAWVGGTQEAYGSCRVCLSVCVCVILQHAFLQDRNEFYENCNATTTYNSTFYHR